MIAAGFAIPGALDTPTGGYRYDREVIARAPAFGVDLQPLALPASFPFPSEADLDRTARLLAGLDPARPLLIDGLAYGAFTPALHAAIPCPAAALVHHPLALESGLAPETAAALAASERAALARAGRVVVTSAATGRTLIRDYGVPSEKIVVAEPGTEREERALGSGGGRVELLAVGAVSRRKGYHVLIEALSGLKTLDWRLTIAGDTERDPASTAALEELLATTGLDEHVALTGAVDGATLAYLHAGADLFVSSSLHEGYGMALAEAMARGLAIVATAAGAAAETVPDGAGLKVPPGDAEALRAALAAAIGDKTLRARLGEASWAAARALPGWDDTARIVCAVLTELATATGATA